MMHPTDMSDTPDSPGLPPEFLRSVGLSGSSEDGVGPPSASRLLIDHLFHAMVTRIDPEHPRTQIPPIDDPAPWVITRADIESGLIGSSLDALMHLSEDPAQCIAQRLRLRLVYSGYEDDPRVIAAIPEIAHFMQNLTAHWPYWLHFLEPEPNNLGLFLTLLGPCSLQITDHTVRAHLGAQSARTLLHMGQSTLRLHEYHALPAHVSQELGRNLQDALCQTFF